MQIEERYIAAMMKSLLLFILLSCSINLFAAISKVELDAIFATFHNIYDDQLPPGQTIRFNPPVSADFDWWDYDMWRGSYVGYRQNDIFLHNIYIMGGLARRDFVTVDGVALIVCHEIGHGLGGAPQQVEEAVSVEGQADYFATKNCLQAFFKLWPRNIENDQLQEQTKQLCTQNYSTSVQRYLCLRTMNAINERVKKFATEGGVCSILTPTNDVAEYTDLRPGVYPSYQCRIDTYVQAALGHRRPRCWFAGVTD